MRNFFSVLLFLATINVCALPSTAAETGWRIDQNTNANGNQLVVMTPRAIEVTLPHQKFKIYSAAPSWSVIYINNQIGTYLEFPHDKFMGSILGRIGNNPLSNDIQVMSLPKPALLMEDGLEYATYDRNVRVTPEERRQLKVKNSNVVLYNVRKIRAKYLRLPDIPKQAKELVCKLTCVPMSNDFPISFSCMDGFKENLTVVSTTLMRKEKSLAITPPNLKKFKRANTETELFGRAKMDDVFELFDDSNGDKKRQK